MTTTPLSPTSDQAVHARGLVKTFGDLRAVDGIDLDVQRGEVFGVLGPNGAGKTTMLQMLATLLPMDGGEAELFGVDVRRHPHVIRQLLGVTGQYASVDENLTGRENLWLFGRLLGLSRSRRARDRRGAARPVRPRGRRRQADREVLRWHAPPARPRRQPDQPATADLPRRAHHRPRPAHPRADVGHHPRAGRRRVHGAAHHAVPRRGRPARRPDRRHRPRPQGGRGHAGRAQGPGRQLDPAAADARRRSRPARPPTSCAGCSARSPCSPRRPAASTSP